MITLIRKTLLSLITLALVVVGLLAYLSAGSEPKDRYYQLINYPEQPETADSTFSVMTYNLGYLSGMTNNKSVTREKDLFDQNLTLAKQLITDLSPEIIGFQEIDFASKRSFQRNQLDSIAEAAQYSFGYKSVNWDKKYVPFPYWPPANHFGKILSGQAIISKFPITKAETIVLNPNLKSPAYYRAFYLDRLLQITEIKHLHRTIKVLNVHLEAFDRDTRLEQIKLVKEVYEKYASEYPVILMGDFNSETPETSNQEDAIDLLMKSDWITSAVPFDQVASSGTFPSEQPEKMIDYIFYNSNFLSCSDARIVIEAKQISDHLPVIAELQINLDN